MRPAVASEGSVARGGEFERGHKGVDSLQTLFARHAEVLGATPQAQADIRAGRYKRAFLDYDWALNDAR